MPPPPPNPQITIPLPLPLQTPLSPTLISSLYTLLLQQNTIATLSSSLSKRAKAVDWDERVRGRVGELLRLSEKGEEGKGREGIGARGITARGIEEVVVREALRPRDGSGGERIEDDACDEDPGGDVGDEGGERPGVWPSLGGWVGGMGEEGKREEGKKKEDKEEKEEKQGSRVDIRLPAQGVEEAIQIVRAALEGCVEFEEGGGGWGEPVWREWR